MKIAGIYTFQQIKTLNIERLLLLPEITATESSGEHCLKKRNRIRTIDPNLLITERSK
jgi:hypothetical protein